MAQALTYVFCLGATKAGTSWLHDQLAAHPGCSLRTIKEYHYFNKSKPAQFVAAIATNEREIARLTAKNATRPEEQGRWARAHIADLAAYNAVLSRSARDDVAFADLLAGKAGKDSAEVGTLVGDFTPAYALLPEAALAKLANFAPDTRAVYLIRDPLSRLWSHARMVAERSGSADLAEAAWALLGRISNGATDREAKGITDRGDYAGIVPKLMRAFDPSRLLVMFYEDMLTAPGFARLCSFLGIAQHGADFTCKVHAGKPLSMSPKDRTSALRFLRPQYEFAARAFPVLPDAWRSAMNEA